MVPQEVPLVAEWTRGSAGVQSGMSIGFSPEVNNTTPGVAQNTRERGSVGRSAPSQYATVHIGGRSGASGNPRLRQQRSSSEGTVQVVLANTAKPSGQQNQTQAVSSAEAQDATKNVAQLVGDCQDSLSAVSKAMENPSKIELPDGLKRRVSSFEMEQQDRNAHTERPTESLSSAAAGALPGTYAAAIATAASLVSQTTGRMMREDRPDSLLIKTLSSDMPIDTNEALHVLQNGHPSSHGKSSAAVAAAAAWKSAKVVQATAPVPGNSSNSGNRQKEREGGLKRKNSSTRPPMLPPPAQTRGVNVALPTGSSAAGGIQIHLDQFAHTAEDAVSTVQQPFELQGEVVCDAVSKASGDSGDTGKQDEYTESRATAQQEEENSMRVTRQSARKKQKPQ
ncbi:hypothetical protein M9434_001467 [Picochlorum sp. BPE23]|nr:hypothetical protein M9434_001467 [Picochlorum sp. BPE23]|mmetsp:Transcript_11389/g.22735  ORF Transcript_11389/g.22735 Transcript_11389/m.22735 type:complete len:395 (+) Transcript_11389:327-1511(+)|eukprot:jgi/Picre1/33242/NNA_008567.t1